MLFSCFCRFAFLRTARILVFNDLQDFRFESSPDVANTTFDDFVPEAVVLNGQCHIIYTNGHHIVVKVDDCVMPLPGFSV